MEAIQTFESKMQCMTPVQLQAEISKVKTQLNLISAEVRFAADLKPWLIPLGAQGDVTKIIPQTKKRSNAPKQDKLYCLCRQPANDDLAMIACDVCNDWWVEFKSRLSPWPFAKC